LRRLAQRRRVRGRRRFESLRFLLRGARERVPVLFCRARERLGVLLRRTPGRPRLLLGTRARLRVLLPTRERLARPLGRARGRFALRARPLGARWDLLFPRPGGCAALRPRRTRVRSRRLPLHFCAPRTVRLHPLLPVPLKAASLFRLGAGSPLRAPEPYLQVLA